MASESVTVYLKGDRNVEVTKRDVTLGDILEIECADKLLQSKIRVLKILRIREEKEQRFVISLLKIIDLIHERYPKVEIQNLGESDVIVTYENQKTPPMIWHLLKTAVVTVIIFADQHFQSWHLTMMWMYRNCSDRSMNWL